MAAIVLLVFNAGLGMALEPGKRLEQYVRATWTVDRGLPQSTVFAVTQTRDGYVWIGTQEGFVRFDGWEFTTYDKTSYPQITSNYAASIHGARDGTLYVGTMGGGLVRLRGEQVQVMTEADGLPSNTIGALYESSDGTLWIGTASGLARMSHDRIAPFASNQLPHQTITALAEDSSGRLWIGTQGGLASYKAGQITRHSAAGGFPSQGVLSLCAGTDGTLWIGTDGEGLFRFRSGNVRKVGRAAGLLSSRINAIYEDRNGTIWIGTQDRGFGRLRDDHAEFDSETNDAVSALFEDREGNLWIGRSGGLTRLADGVIVAFSKAEGLLDDDVKTVAGDRDGTIWAGTRQGLGTLDGSRRLTKRDGLSSSHILSTWVGRDGSLWIGTYGGLNRVRGSRLTIYTAKDGLPGDAVTALFENSRGVIWVGTNQGLTRLVDGEIAPDSMPPPLSGESISAIYESRDGALWVGTHERGLHRILRGSVQSFTKGKGLLSDTVLSIYQDSAETIWIGTGGGGLNRYRNGKLSAITNRHGLQDDSVFAILEDNAGNLWMSCNKGIFRASLTQLNAVADGARRKVDSVIYGRTDGMRSRECNGGTQPVAWKTPDGKLWFATTGGVAMIDPQKVVIGAAVPPVLVAGIYADRTKIASGGKIPPGHQTLEFHYTAPTFRTPDKLRFFYKLEDFDERWRDAQTRRVAYYTNVPPGRYRFYVRAVNGEGVTSPPSTVDLVVQPFFYQTPLFWALIAMSVILAAWKAHQYRIRLIRASAERFKLLFDRNLAGVYRARIDGRILDCNQAGLKILGFSAVEDLSDRSIFDSYTEPSQAEDLIRRVRQDGAVSGVETSLRRTDGTPIWVLQNVSLPAAPPGKEVLEATLIDITDRKRAEEQIRYQAYHDTLTGLPNRALFKDRLTVAVAHAERRGRQVAVLFLDLDRFKLINDTLGHTVGDHLLQGMADRLKGCVREEDSVARVGGDEFTILLMDQGRPADAMVVARKILDVVARPIVIDGHELYVTCSIGISMSPSDGEDAEALLKNADNALYRAKEAGKNNYELCTPSMTRLAAERLALENALRQAIERNEFLVLYQPQYDLRERRIVGVEALLRWDRPGKGIVRPAEFIAAAEESRLIVPMGEFVLQAAAREAKTWNDQFPLRVAVNVAAPQFQQRHLVRTIQEALHHWALDPSRLEIEITESTAMQNPAVTADILNELKDLGVSIVIDDFGIGHSSLNYLKRFPIDGLKIDRTFVQDMITDASDAAIVAAVIAMAHALGLRVTAEGVETEEQLAFLESHGCSSFQGYLLSRPIPAEAMAEMLRSEISFPSASLHASVTSIRSGSAH